MKELCHSQNDAMVSGGWDAQQWLLRLTTGFCNLFSYLVQFQLSSNNSFLSMNEITIYKTSITLYVQSSHESTDAVHAASTIQSARLLSMQWIWPR